MDETTPRSPLADALARAQGELKDPRREKSGQVRGKSGYRYAGLDDLLQAVRPVLARNGIAVTQPIVVRDGSRYLVTQLRHAGGEVLESWWELAWQGSPQDRGSEITYARRYTLEAMVCVAPSDGDDDAASISDGSSQTSQPSRRDAPAPARPAANTPSAAAPVAAVAPAPSWSADTWAKALADADAGVTLDEVVWYNQTQHRSRCHPQALDAATRAKALAHYTSPVGYGAVRKAVDQAREVHRKAFFGQWSRIKPIPRKGDGASPELIESLQTESDEARRLVMLAWYGVDSLKLTPLDQLDGPRGLSWLREVTPDEFGRAVDIALSSAGELGAA